MPDPLVLFSTLPRECACMCAHRHTHTHTILKLTDYFQEFLGSLVHWEISEKQVLVTEKRMKEVKFICILELNRNS